MSQKIRETGVISDTHVWDIIDIPVVTEEGDVTVIHRWVCRNCDAVSVGEPVDAVESVLGCGR